MATIQTIQGTDVIANSRADINTNFSNLNSDKIETSVLDTDTTLAANSDSKVATQKAVKAYVDAGGNVNASTTSKGIVEEATVAEIGAGTAAGGTSARLFINPSSTVSTSAGAGDVGKIPRLNASGILDTTFVVPSIKIGSNSQNVATTGTQTIAHGLGKTPILVDITASFRQGNTEQAFSRGFYNGTVTHTVYFYVDDGGTGDTDGTDTDYVIKLYAGGGTAQARATIAVDATNITLTWSKSSTPTGTAYFTWFVQ